MSKAQKLGGFCPQDSESIVKNHTKQHPELSLQGWSNKKKQLLQGSAQICISWRDGIQQSVFNIYPGCDMSRGLMCCLLKVILDANLQPGTISTASGALQFFSSLLLQKVCWKVGVEWSLFIKSCMFFIRNAECCIFLLCQSSCIWPMCFLNVYRNSFQHLTFTLRLCLGENNSDLHFKVQQVFTMANLGVLQELHQWSCKSKGEVRRCCHATNYSDTIRFLYIFLESIQDKYIENYN